MAANEIHVNDIGTIFEVTLMDGASIVDISTATEKTIILVDADETVVLHPAEFKTDGTDGILQYTTVANDLGVSGGWQIQARVKLPSGEWSSDTAKFKVYENLDGGA